jgi:uncharacterized membrane protein YhaH (DUF805 family)
MEVAMQPMNPYQTPGAAVADLSPEQFGEIRILRAAGRLGRVRYIAYGIGLTILVYLCIGALAVLARALGMDGLGGAASVVGFLALAVLQVILTIQRCHDFNMSGWLSLVGIIPLINLMFWIIPGTQGPNRFGNPPPPNSTGAVVVALILPLVFVVGILAAIAIPAYQDFAKRAHAAQQAK